MVLLLPHGYEFTGPEHSNCRIERFLQLCNSDATSDVESNKVPNMRIVIPTTPANCFHMLRRQMKSKYRKPLIVGSPKSILRNPLAVNKLEDMGPGTHFQSVIGDPEAEKHKNNIKKLILCSGKAAYELMDFRKSNNMNHIAIVRIEELVPFPTKRIAEELNKYNKAEIIWFQEEPQNLGAFLFVEIRLRNYLKKQVRYLGHPPLGPSALGTVSLQRVVHENIFNQLKKE